MRLRPAPAHWFETYVPRNETVYALQALAETGVVQLELDPRLAEPLLLEPVSELIDRFQRERDKYSDFLPVPDRSPQAHVEAPENIARKAIDCLDAWRTPVDTVLERKRRLEAERQNLVLLRECVAAMRDKPQDAAHLAPNSDFLFKGVFACPLTQTLAAEIGSGIDESVSGRQHRFFILVDEPDCRESIEKAYRDKACVKLKVPTWLSSDPQQQKTRIEARLAAVNAECNAGNRSLEEMKQAPGLAAALADIDLLAWYLEHSPQLGAAGRLCHVTGWTSADNVEQLQQAFRREGIHGVIRFAAPPAFSKVPVNMGQPWWARPFLFIVEMLGTPDSTEIDTGKLLPVIVPLLFGYMFPDVGHGLVLVLVSLLLYRRWPAGRFLVPCGLSAMLFGVVFGEVFGQEGVLEPLWLSPLEHPLEVLLAPLLFGVMLILLGLVFNGAEALWRGEVRQWLSGEAAILVLYPALLASLFLHEALWVAAVALVWFLAGQVLAASKNRLSGLGRGLGLLIQSIFELAQNTLSFLRVGAFALAHAALTAAVLGLSEGVDNEALHLLMLVLGHVFIISLEGLVVFVQTTRLVLLEFFIHFLRAEGRMFNPIGEPPQGRDVDRP